MCSHVQKSTSLDDGPSLKKTPSKLALTGRRCCLTQTVLIVRTHEHTLLGGIVGHERHVLLCLVSLCLVSLWLVSHKLCLLQLQGHGALHRQHSVLVWHKCLQTRVLEPAGYT